MSLICDGDIDTNNKRKQLQRRKNSTSLLGKDIAFEKEFKGFAKVPVVLLNRHDINGYLPPKGTKQLLKTSPVHLRRLSQICSVKLKRDDLDTLVTSLIPKRRDSVSSDSDSEIIDVNMAARCNICEKLYANNRKLQKHQSKKHMIVYEKPQKRVSFSDHVIIHEVKEYHKCRKCSKIFEDYKSLKCHMKRYHKKRKCYICHYCNKNFVDRMFFKVHIKLHCDVCGLYLQNKSKHAEHKRTVCRTFKLHPCKTCNESYFKFMDLKDHSYEHLGTFFICDICKDQFLTKCAISHHVSFLHSKERPVTLYGMRNLGTERLYLCNFCDESSVDKDVIEAHVNLLPDLANRAMTGYKDYYFCDQCLKKFDTETHMLQHKWTHFLKTSDNSQERAETKVKYNLNQIPEHMKPKVVLERLKLEKIQGVQTVTNGIKKSVLKSKNLMPRHRCENCGKYYSSRFCLNRHIETQHCDYESLRCKVCEETFVWPSLLRNHKCIRLNHPEMPFDDARPEIHFDNMQELTQNGFDDLNIDESDDYMHIVDFEVPAPVQCDYSTNNGEKYGQLNGLGYKLVMQEVPIEF
ncbi:zinc finger protein 62 homolog [Manduca sexta]|uniref:zinc finger protein 62 homolog n=1 Tax=Manduca sexta TaxID=7130 RepID=UPI001890AB53|nr:zinc finger protein 62 homolog [Manduca sexta]